MDRLCKEEENEQDYSGEVAVGQVKVAELRLMT